MGCRVGGRWGVFDAAIGSDLRGCDSQVLSARVRSQRGVG